MTGKLADTVLAVRNGVQIARKYQPVVFNPSTPAQVAQRARLKLLSQLSAVMGSVIAMRRVGSVSARNRFTKVNFPATSFADSTAQVTLTNIKLTESVVGFLPIQIERAEEKTTVGTTIDPSGGDFSKIVYILFEKRADESLRLIGSRVISDISQAAEFPLSNLELVAYAYGIRENTDYARAVFGNMEVPTAETVAQLVTSRTLTEQDITLSETVATTLAAAQSRDDDKKESKSKK